MPIVPPPMSILNYNPISAYNSYPPELNQGLEITPPKLLTQNFPVSGINPNGINTTPVLPILPIEDDLVWLNQNEDFTDFIHQLPPPSESNIIINPTINQNRIITYDEETRNTIDNPDGPDIRIAPVVDSLFGGIPQNVLTDIIDRQEITNRTNNFIREAARPKNDILEDTLNIHPEDNTEEDTLIILEKQKLNETLTQNIKFAETNTNESENNPITGQAITDAVQSQPWDFRNNDEMVEIVIKVLNDYCRII